MLKWISALVAFVLSILAVFYLLNRFRQNLEDDPYYMYGDSLYKPEPPAEGTAPEEDTKDKESHAGFAKKEEYSSMVH
ncbi:MAG: hypothetical protein OEY59_13040 [Deltaproteobacteria bacterium]|nr:hypothetical protein [Deltaproteobacteria bacterium]